MLETVRRENVSNLFKAINKSSRTALLYFLHWTYVLPFSSLSIVEFEQVNAGRVASKKDVCLWTQKIIISSKLIIILEVFVIYFYEVCVWQETGDGIGRICKLEKPQSYEETINKVKEHLGLKLLRVAYPMKQTDARMVSLFFWKSVGGEKPHFRVCGCIFQTFHRLSLSEFFECPKR